MGTFQCYSSPVIIWERPLIVSNLPSLLLKRQDNKCTVENCFSSGQGGVFDFSASCNPAVRECSDEVARHIVVQVDLMVMPRRSENGGIPEEG